MKRFILIAMIILIIFSFSLYILGFDLVAKSISPEYNGITMDSVNTVSVSTGLTEPAPSSPVKMTKQRGAGPGDLKNAWELVWADEFDGPYLNLEYWTKVDRKDNFNNELQYYTPQNSYLENGCLYLTALAEAKSGKEYTSGMVQTMDKLSLCYGKIEVRMKLPVGQGLFPAFWLLSYTENYEIDIMEMIGSEPNLIYGVIHYLENNKRYMDLETTKIDSPDKFHVYTLEWEKDELRWYVDGELFFRVGEDVPSENMYIIFTLAVGGNWPGSPDSNTVFPSSLVVDYVRIYQKMEYRCVDYVIDN